MNRAACRYCGKRFERSGIARHIAACRERRARLDDSEVQRTHYHHLQVCDAESRLYWLYILAAPNVTLSELDELLRLVWLECCYHISAFMVGERQYLANPDHPFAGTLRRTRIADLPEQARIRYIYDFGSSTALTIRRLKAIEHPVCEQRIEIAARNDPPEFACECGRNAIAAETTGWDARYLCRECLAKFDGDITYLAPLTNSPRFGVCGYDRGTVDIEGDYPSFEEAQETIAAIPWKREERVMVSGSAEERAEMVREYLYRLTQQVGSPRALRAAVLIDRHLEDFAEQLRRIVVDAIERYRADRSQKPTSPAHVIALFLLSRRPDAELFTLLVEGLSQHHELSHVWNGALDESRLRRALFASLCRNSPESLVSIPMI